MKKRQTISNSFNGGQVDENVGQKITETEREAIRNLYTRIKDEFLIDKIILFGSKARGDAEKYSDVDLLVLTNKTKTRNDRERLSDIAADINIDYGVALSCLYFNLSEWELGDSVNPFLKDNIEKEGIVLDVS
jgi:predicted nucleotidyltransferase